MECNKDEALRAKEIAEKLFDDKDFIGAKKFALVTQNLFPALDGLEQLIATLDVYIASQRKVHGENDWYAILRVNFTADEDTVKKQYRKLALLLHPDKNKSVGAEGAFKLISEAWSVLSNKSRRTLYDEKRSAKSFLEIIFQTNKKRNGSTKVAPATGNLSHKPSAVETFWTSCYKCKMQYEYLKLYLNHTLLCPNCHEPFLATQTKSPCEFVSSGPISQQNQPNSNGANPGSFNHPNFQWCPFSRTAGVASAAASSTAAAHAANVVCRTYEKVRREREEAQAAARYKEAIRSKNNALKRDTSASGILKAGQSNTIPAEKRGGIGDDPGNDHTEVVTQQIPAEANRSNRNLVDLLKLRMAGNQSNQSREFYLCSTKNMLTELSKSAIDVKLKQWKSAASMKLDVKDNAKKRQKLSEAGKKESKDVVHQNVTSQEQPVEPKSETKSIY
ncbi:uncharacterized protein LOC122055334 [Zingiber officinale]|uniref:uncharacterized protein LOC122055334 n=1 Tax=Zingiber officinale TaxID=94328 RepID=UPI001C4C18C9|nr:uncharacterized protein LOC122055334 [Zingiber officinale]XP_042472648.1 uncharacterized protein LOC122055334 [Zingiber officinale]XP_042472649.1 uncharacterized protein LOC122055334 [Zingiber officinale]